VPVPQSRHAWPPRVFIQTEDFDLSTEVAALRAGDARVGAVCSFVGTVRDRNDGSTVQGLELEHYPGMTERAIESMIDAALARFDILGARVIHRIGPLHPRSRSCWSQ
jgi:molybdopterin synthase catalytic subunit